jgi:hypothetical protein
MSSVFYGNNGSISPETYCQGNWESVNGRSKNMKCQKAWIHKPSASGIYTVNKPIQCSDVPSSITGQPEGTAQYCTNKTDLYIRKPGMNPKSLPIGVSPVIADIDSLEYQNYVKSGQPLKQTGPQGIVNLDKELLSQNKNYVHQIDGVVKQITDLYNKLFNANMSLDNLLSQFNEGFSNKKRSSKQESNEDRKNRIEDFNVKPYLVKSSLKESFAVNSMPLFEPPLSLVQKYINTNIEIQKISNNKNIDNILEERGIVAKQQNYIYILMLLITLGTVGVFYRYTKR